MSASSFGRYQLLEQIAVGGMAEIWLAVQAGPAGFAKRLVLKRILPHLARDPDFVQMFFDEARLAAQLSHPHIAQVVDFGEVDGAYYLAMELVRGPDLRRLLRACSRARVSVPVPVALRIMAQTCSALDYAHRACDPEGTPLQIIHRDVSPQNVLVSLDGNARLVDFGIARAASKSHHTENGFVKGKFNYMAPEQLSGGAIDARTDLFAVGLVLYELLTGKQAYEGEGQSIIGRVLEARVAPVLTMREDLPAEVCAALERALQRDPAARHPDAAAFESELERCLAAFGQPTTAHEVARFLESVSLASGDPLHLPGDSSARHRAVVAAPARPGSGRLAASAAAPDATDSQDTVTITRSPFAAPETDSQDTVTITRSPFAAPDTDSQDTETIARSPFAEPEPAPAGAEPEVAQVDPQQDQATVHMMRPGAALGDADSEASTAIRKPRRRASSPPQPSRRAALGDEGPDAPFEATTKARVPGKPRVATAVALVAGLAALVGLAWVIFANDEDDEAAAAARVAARSPVAPFGSRPPHSAEPRTTPRPGEDLAATAPQPVNPSEPPTEAAPEDAPEPAPSAPPGPGPGDAPANGTAALDRPELAVRPAVRPASTGGRHAPALPRTGAQPAPADSPAPAAEAAREPGFLSLTSQPWTTVELDGESAGTTPLLRRKLAPGLHRLKLTNEEQGIERELTVEIASGEERKEVVRFGKAKISFLALPWAQIQLGQRTLGQTPLPPQELYEGIYELRASNPDTGKQLRRTLVVEAGQDATVKLDLRADSE